MSTRLTELPADLPVPVDDGAAAHLPGIALPDFELAATDGARVKLSGMRGRVVVYVYPMTGRPDVALPDGWEAIPGARGCTPQSCGFRDHHAELRALDAQVFGLSAQTTEYQREVQQRLHLPFALLSDVELLGKRYLNLPMFQASGMELYKRLTLILRDGRIEHVFYPVFPPDRNAEAVLEWLRAHPV